MKPAVHGIIIFSPAGRAHLKSFHGGLGPVIGNIFNNGKSWTAIGAVDERIFKPPVCRVLHFQKTVFADRHIRGDQRSPGIGCAAFNNLK